MKIKIVFGSEVGTTKYVSELLQKRFIDRNHQVDLYQAGVDGYAPDFNESEIILFGSPTYFAGQLQSDMSILIDVFHPDLSLYKVAVFALGDSGYPTFCAAAGILEGWVQKHSGTLVTPSLKVDGYPHDFEVYTNWVNQILEVSR